MGSSDVLLIINGELDTPDNFQSYAILEFDVIPPAAIIYERTNTATLVLYKLKSLLERGATELTVTRLPETLLSSFDVETLNGGSFAPDPDLEVTGPTFSVTPTPEDTRVEVNVTELVFGLDGRNETNLFLKIANIGEFQLSGTGNEFYSRRYENGEFAPTLTLGVAPTTPTPAAPTVSS